MALFRFTPRWYDMARSWDEQQNEPMPRDVVDWNEQRDRDIEDWLNYRLLGAAINVTSPAVNDILVYDGTQWINHNGAYTSSAPTWTNLTVGNGSTVAYYGQRGKQINHVGFFTFGSTSSVTGDITGTLPANPIAGLYITGDAVAVDSSAASVRTWGGSEIYTTAFGNALHFAWNGSSGTGATTPITWATGDLLAWNITYPVA